MKKLFTLTLLLTLAAGPEARSPKAEKKPLLELGGKASVFTGENNLTAGIGIEAVINPVNLLGFRYELLDARFGNGLVTIGILDISSLDALVYLPMAGMEPYIHAGVGVSTAFGSGSSVWIFNVRGGLGVNYRINKNLKVFGEPGILINRLPGAGTTTTFRLSLGVRLGLIK
jgi:hypothetical protein